MKTIYADAVRVRTTGLAAAALPVRDAMSTPVVCVGADVSLAEALRVMVRADLRHLAVVDDRGHCLGVLSDRAVTAVWADAATTLDRRTARETLGHPAALVGTEAPVREVARLMLADQTDAAAVVDRDGAVLGIVTGSDLIRLLAR